jgi:hypothetical protein
MKDFSKLANPKVFGPGAWLVIHTLAYEAKTRDKKVSFERDMKTICDGLMCNTCSHHCNKYQEQNPIRDYWNIKDQNGEDIGMFKWSWAFHNAVNVRLGKPVMDFKTAYQLYSKNSPAVCTQNCGDEEHKNSHSYSESSYGTIASAPRSNLIKVVPKVQILRSRSKR